MSDNDSVGYGLAQWTYHTRKCNLLNFAKSCGQSVGDLETQLRFLIKELSTSYKLLLDELKTAKNVRIASDAVLTVYERPADQSELVQLQRANIGERYLAKLAGKTPPVYSESDCTSTSLTTAQTTTEQPSTSLKYKIGDVMSFTGSVHHSSANATSGPSCKPGKVKITAVYASGKHPYHVIAEAGGGSTAYGWVDTDKLSTISEIKIGDVVQFKGAHYASSNATADAGIPKAGAAKVTAIAKGAKHPYHLIHTDKQSTVYGWWTLTLWEKRNARRRSCRDPRRRRRVGERRVWVDGITKLDGWYDPGADCESCPFPCENHNNKPSRK